LAARDWSLIGVPFYSAGFTICAADPG